MPADASETYLAALASDTLCLTLSRSIVEWQQARDAKRSQDAEKSKKRKARTQGVVDTTVQGDMH